MRKLLPILLLLLIGAAITAWIVGLLQPRNVLSAHTAPVTSVAFSPDGQTLASASLDDTIRLWRMSDHKLLNTIETKTGGVNSVLYLPDGKTLVSAHEDRTIRFWNASSGTLLKTLKGHTAPVKSLSLTRDGKMLASASWDGTVKLWRVQDGVLLKTINAKDTLGRISSVALTPDGRAVTAGGERGIVMQWLLGPISSTEVPILSGGALGSRIYFQEVATGPLTSVAYSPDGRALAAGSREGHAVRIWTVPDGGDFGLLPNVRDWNVPFPSNEVTVVAFSPNSQILASNSYQRVFLWRISDGKEITRFTDHSGEVTSLAFSPDGHTIALGSLDKTVRLWPMP